MQSRRNWIKTTAATFAATTVGAASVFGTTLQQVPVRVLYIKNLHCEGCAKRLRNSVYKIEGVLKVQTDVKKGIAVITPTTGGNPSAKVIWETALLQKFEVAKLVTPAGTYNEKPAS